MALSAGMVSQAQAANWSVSTPTVSQQTLGTGDVGSITSSGSIATGAIPAVVFTGGGTLVNSGRLSSSVSGGSTAATVQLTADNGTITNSGSIVNTASSGSAIASGFGVVVTGIDNLPGGTIQGANGIRLQGNVGSINNGAPGSTAGLISATNGSGNAIVVDGAITGNVTNYGTIRATATALRQYSEGPGGSIGGNIVNFGTISGYEAIAADSIAGSISNGGLIQGNGSGHTVAAISVRSGALSITNTGTIQGGIYDRDAVAGIAISGGTASAPGTLTGGTITGHSVSFASGAQILAANISAAGGVTNSGAILTLNTPQTITGNYVQSGTGVLNIGVAGTLSSQHGELVVTNAATITKVSLTANSGFQPVAGQSFTIVSAAASGSNLSGATATGGVAFHLSTIVSGATDYLVVTIDAVAAPPSPSPSPTPPPPPSPTYASIGSAAGGTAATMGGVMDQSGNNPAMQPIFAALQGLTASEQAQALKQLAPSQGTSGATQLMTNSELSYMVSNAILNQAHSRFAANQGATGASAGSSYRNSKVWGQILAADANRASESGADGYTFSSWGLAFGADTKLTDSLLAGVALSWGRGWESGLDQASGQGSRTDLYQVTGYTTWEQGPLYVDGQFGLGITDNRESRAIGFLSQTAGAHYGGREYVAKVDGGYRMPVGAVTLTPIASMRWLRLETGSYTEAGAGSANLSVAASTADQVESGLGAKIKVPVPTPLGTFSPEISAEWIHDYINGDVQTTAFLGSVPFQTAAPLPSPDGARIGAALPLYDNGEMSVKAEYSGEFRSDFSSNGGVLDVKMKF